MSMTVTATQSGTAAKNGTGLAVLVLNGALPPASQTGATASGNTTALNASLTPHAAGSQIITAIVSYAGGSGSFGWEAGETGLLNTADPANGQVAGFAKLTAVTPSVSPVTAGAASGPGANYHLAIAEILGTTASSLSVDPSTPVPVYSSAGLTATSASFLPPPGALLVAAALANTTASGTQSMAITDTMGLAWTQLVINPGSFPNTGVWVALVPSWTVNPAWSAARSGLAADADAVNHASQVGQFLAAHAITPVYAGTALITPSGLVGYGYGGITDTSLGSYDVDQPFTLPAGHTAVGRVTVPLIPQGNAADVTVSLCADSSGSPGTVIASTVIPAEHITALASGPLATAQSALILPGDMTGASWQSPVSGSGSPAFPSSAVSGNFILTAGGSDVSGNFTAQCFTAAWAGGNAPGTVLPQPSLPHALDEGTLIATGDVLVCAGGLTSLSALTASVSAASWSPASGQVQAWTSQVALPVATQAATGAFDAATDTVYMIGGQTGLLSSSATASVYRATASNGQLGAWSTCPPLPYACYGAFAGVVNGWLVVAGGVNSSGTYLSGAWCAQVNPDGSLGSWQPCASLPFAAAWYGGAGNGFAVVPGAGLLVLGGINGSGSVYEAAVLPVTAGGPGTWQSWQVDPSSNAGNAIVQAPLGVFSAASGWQVLAISPGNGVYASGPLTQVTSVSVPLPATGLTGGGTYHVLLHQSGGTAADYVQVPALPGAQASSAQTRPASGGSWTAMPGHLYSLPMGVYDQTPGGQVLHLWDDSGARVTTMLWGSASGQLLGVLEATVFPSGSPRPALPSVAQMTYGSTGLPSGLVQLA